MVLGISALRLEPEFQNRTKVHPKIHMIHSVRAEPFIQRASSRRMHWSRSRRKRMVRSSLTTDPHESCKLARN